MVLEHHGYWRMRNNRVFGYRKEPAETRFFRVSSYLGDSHNHVMSKDWDTGRMDDFSNPSSINEGTYHTRRIGEYEWALENWKMRYKYNPDEPDTLFSKAVLKQSEVDAILPGTLKEEIELRDGCYMLPDDELTGIRGTGQYLYSPLVYLNRDAMNYSRNMFDSRSVSHLFGMPEQPFIYDSGMISYIVETAGGGELTVSFDEMPDDLVFAMYSDERPDVDVMVSDMGNHIEFQLAENGRYYGFVQTECNFVLITFGNIHTAEYYDRIKTMIEFGRNDNPGYELPYNKCVSYDWRIPKVEDWCQLFGMSGNLDSRNIIKSVFSSAKDTVIPYTGSNIGEDLLGCRITPSGQRSNIDGMFKDYGKAAYYATYWQAAVQDVPFKSPTLSLRPEETKYKIILDNGDEMPEGMVTTKPYFRNVRLCKPLSDEELGYKLLVDSAHNKICVVSYGNYMDGNLPDVYYGYNELERGTLRGLAVRCMSLANKTISRSYSELQREVSKTGNNGSYGWLGFDGHLK